MDLALYGRVFRRFWVLVLGGLTLAVVLTILSVAKVSPGGLTWRSQEQWKSTSTVLLTRDGRTFADADVYSALTALYSQLANGDAVQRNMRKAGADKSWTLTATPVTAPNPQAIVPVLALTGVAPTPADAVKATILGRKAFIDFVSRQKGAARFQVLQNASPPKVAKPRSKTLPIIVFLCMLSATVALVFILENLRPARPKLSALTTNTAAVSSAGRQHSHSAG